MNILAVDATGEALSLAVLAEGKVHKAWRAGRSHDELLHDAVDALLARAKISTAQLGAVAAASGPGRFTGIRIGMAFASVAGLTLKIPALAVSRLEALAELSTAPRVCAVLPGWKNESYYQVFRRSTRGGVIAETDPAWAGEAAWPKVKAEMGSIAFLEQDVGAAELLTVAARQLSRAKRPPFSPLYLKPAGYEVRK